MDILSVQNQLKHQSKAIAALAAGLTSEQAVWKPDQENWSVLEVLNHLVYEEIHDFRQHINRTLPSPEEAWLETGSEGEEQGANRDLDEALAVFVAEREKSIAWLASLSGNDWDAEIVFHWGTLTAGDMLVSWLAHDLLHIRQLVELRYAINKHANAPYSPEYAGKW